MNFVSNTKNPYEKILHMEKKEDLTGKFISKSKASTIHMFRNNTANTRGEKVKFKNVWYLFFKR